MKLLPQPELRAITMRNDIGAYLNARGLTGVGVEIGTLFGAYAVEILRTWSGSLNCVDPWLNQDEAVYFDGANKQDMNAVYATARRILGRIPRCKLHRMFSVNGAGKFEDESLDFAYDDGNHAVDAVRDDISAWWPKIKIGGLVCGHDFFTRYDKDTNSDAQTAVMELANIIGVYPHVTWCTSWWFIKTKEADRKFRAACISGEWPRAVYTDNTGIDCVVVLPVAKFDWNLAVKMLAWWGALEMNAKRKVVVLCSTDLNEFQLAALAAVGPKGTSIVIATGVVEAGYFGTPNRMFRTGIEHVEKNHPGKAMLWIEADAIPLRSGWIDAIMEEYRSCGRPFLGDVYRSGTVPHMTGNAVYHPNWRKIAPSLAALASQECGWDTICSHETLPKCHPSKTIQQVWRPPHPITGAWMAENIKPSTVLFHQCKDGSLIDLLCAKNGLAPIPLASALCASTYHTQARKEKELFPVTWVDEPEPVPAPPPPAPIVRSIGSVEILIVTYAKDIPFLRYCLKSIEKHCRGFAGVTLVVPQHECGQYGWVRHAKVKYFDEAAGKGMLHHEVQVCRADEWCPSCEAILHVDADCIFWRDCTPDNFAPNGKPLLVRERYAGIRNKTRLLWQKAVENAAGFKPEYETMVRHPQIHLRDVYPRARELVEDHTKKPFDEYVLSGKNDFPQSFAELPLLGAVAIRDFRDRYTCEDYDWSRDAHECGLPLNTPFQYIYRRDRNYLCECWSHGGIDRYKSDIEAWLGGKVPAYVIK